MDHEISEFRNTAVKNNNEFQAFLAANPKTYPHGIYDLIERKASEKAKILSQTPPIRKALLAATQLSALEVILKTNDQDALNKYLSLLSCEATLIEDKPSMLKRFFQ